MAAFVHTTGSPLRFFDPNGLTPLQRAMRAFQNQDTNSAAAMQRLMQLPQFVINGTTDTNTAAASSPILNLTDEGVTFPANTYREIVIDVVAFNGANRWNFTTKQRVLGGTDPTLQGIEQFLTDCDATYSFTTADGTTTTEVAAECIGPAWADSAAPVAGNVASNAFTISWLGTALPARLILPGDVQNFDAAAAAGDARSYQHGNVNLTNGTTDVFISDVATPTAANFSNASAVRVRAKVFPPVQVPVLIDTAATPDKVFIGALGLSADVVTWSINVFVGDLRTAGPLV